MFFHQIVSKLNSGQMKDHEIYQILKIGREKTQSTVVLHLDIGKMFI